MDHTDHVDFLRTSISICRLRSKSWLPGQSYFWDAPLCLEAPCRDFDSGKSHFGKLCFHLYFVTLSKIAPQAKRHAHILCRTSVFILKYLSTSPQYNRKTSKLSCLAWMSAWISRWRQRRRRAEDSPIWPELYCIAGRDEIPCSGIPPFDLTRRS